jgi:hypothetical protein
MRTSTREELAKVETLLAKIQALPVSKAAHEAEAAATLETRKAADARRQNADQRGAVILPERRAALEAAEAAVKAYDAGRRAVLDTAVLARVALNEAGQAIEYERREAEIFLLSNYDPRIDEAITFFRDKREELFCRNPNTQTIPGAKNIFTERRPVTVYTNYPALMATLAYCLEALHTLEAMRLIPAVDLELLEKLKREIPNADAEQETVGGTIHAGGSYFPPIPAPSRTGRLLTKAKQLLGY